MYWYWIEKDGNYYKTHLHFRQLNFSFDKEGKIFCLQWGLNSWPLVYKTNALPLSYRGPRCVGDKMQQNCLGDTRIWTMDLSDCSRLLYHWAISPRPMLEVWSAQMHMAGECGWGTCALRSNRVSTASVV